MFAYIVRRLVAVVIMLFVMSIVTFLLFFAAPTDPARLTCGKNCTPAAHRGATGKALGFDKPIAVQYGDFVKGIVVGRDYPDDPELRKAAPEHVAHVPGPVPGLLAVQTTSGHRPDQGRAARHALARPRRLRHVDRRRRRSSASSPRCNEGTVVDRGIVGISLVFYSLPDLLHRPAPATSSSRSSGSSSPIPSTSPLTENPCRLVPGPAAALDHPGRCSTRPATSG